MRRWTGMLAMAAAATTAAACGENEIATEHIRSVVAAASGVTPDSAVSTVASSAGGTPEAPVLKLPNGDTLSVRPAVVSFYAARQYLPAWTDDDEILARGIRLLEAIGSAWQEGLDPDRYHYSTAHAMARLLEEDAVEDQEMAYLGNLDLLLTESFVRLAQDLEAGTLDPTVGDRQWRVPRDTVAEQDLLQALAEGQDPRAVLATVRPRVPYYDRLARTLIRFRQVDEAGGWGTVPEGESLEAGDRDPRIAALRARLSAGDDRVESQQARAGAGDPTLFDERLREALEHFQERHGLLEDGALGPKSIDALNVPVGERIASLRLNLDRWRWLPRELGEMFILVNVAGFELEVVENGRAIESMNVVVGETANRTPIFQDTLEHMVVNPYWNVPESIAEEEIMPIVQRDPTYLARNNYEMVRENGTYRIRQRPGPGNALGNVKFLFPNKMNIYLHDTPADHLFSQRSRAFSHGCIRVERPDDLARILLEKLSDRDPSDYDALRGRSGEQWVKLDKIPVYILYFTAWTDEDGTARFHEDIYERDETLAPETDRKLAPVEVRPIAAAID